MGVERLMMDALYIIGTQGGAVGASQLISRVLSVQGTTLMLRGASGGPGVRKERIEGDGRRTTYKKM